MTYRIRTTTEWLDPLFHSWQDAAEALRLAIQGRTRGSSQQLV